MTEGRATVAQKLREAGVLKRAAAAVLVLLVAAVGVTVRSIGPADAALDPSTLGMRPSGGFLNPERLDEYEALLGRPIRWYVGFADRDSPEKMRSSVFGQMRADSAALPPLAGQLDLVMSVPLAFGQANTRTEAGRAEIAANLGATAAGAYDDDFRAVANSLVLGGYGDAVLRLGHELTGSWAPWSAEYAPAEYVEAYRHVHQVMREVSPAFRFEWNVMRDEFPRLGPPAYPGDAFVDFIGMDVYHRPDSPDQLLTERVWENRYQKPLQQHLDFAVAHGKPVAYSEWAVGQAEDPAFIGKMAEWFRSLPPSGAGSLGYQIYWNTNEARFNLDLYPQNRAALLAEFGAGGPGNPSPTATSSTPSTTTPTATSTTPSPTTTPPASTTSSSTTVQSPTSTAQPRTTTSSTNPAAPGVAPSITLRSVELREGNRVTVLPVRIALDAPATSTVVVALETRSGSADADKDFYGRTATIEIPAGSSGGWFGVRIMGDRVKEQNEEFRVVATSAEGATIARSTARILLKNDD